MYFTFTGGKDLIEKSIYNGKILSIVWPDIQGRNDRVVAVTGPNGSLVSFYLWRSEHQG